MQNSKAAIGIIGVPNREDIEMLEKELGKPIKMLKKNGKIVLLVGKGLFKKKIVCNERKTTTQE